MFGIIVYLHHGIFDKIITIGYAQQHRLVKNTFFSQNDLKSYYIGLERYLIH